MNEDICTTDDVDVIPFHVLFDSELHKKIKKEARHRRMSFSEFINDVLREAVFFLDKVSMKFADLACNDFGEALLEFKTKRRLLIERDLKYKLFDFQNNFKLRSKGAVLRFIMRRYLQRLEKIGEDSVREFLERTRVRWAEQIEKVKVWKRRVDPLNLKNYHRDTPTQLEVVNSYSYVTEIRLL